MIRFLAAALLTLAAVPAMAEKLSLSEISRYLNALTTLEAAWRLNSAIRDDPVLITQLIAIAVTRLHAGVLRKLEDVPEIWQTRLRELDYRTSFLDAMRLEGWFWL